jgi:hypothetical protein
VGDEFKIRFWHHLWCGDQALKKTFSVIYSIARVKDASMVDYLELSSDSYQWNVSFIRVLMIEKWMSLLRFLICCILLD